VYIALTNQTGTVTERYRYSAFGLPRVLNADFTAKPGHPPQIAYTYTGREWEPETNHSFYRARFYAPESGRFLSRDPIGEQGGMNLYGYVLNDPINRFDPLGLAWESTPTQGLHYNDRKSGFGFGLGVDDNGRLVPTPNTAWRKTHIRSDKGESNLERHDCRQEEVG
jgi:RHS repeat-associated protein